MESPAKKKKPLLEPNYDDFINGLITSRFKTIDEIVALKSSNSIESIEKEIPKIPSY